MTKTTLRIATRRSKLAMVQTLWVKAEIERNIPNIEVSIEAMATQGDKILDVALAKIGDKGLFTKELEAQMLLDKACLLYTSPSPRDIRRSRMPSSA